MNRYFEHMHTKSPHERRQHAMRVAGVVTALIFAGWVTSLSVNGLGGAGGSANVAATPDQAAQTAAAAAPETSLYGQQNQLVAATSSDF